MVQAGIDWLTRERLSTPRIVDLCAGSGAIGLSLVTEVRGAQVWAVEKVSRTYDWTMRNWRRISRLDPLAADNYHLELGDATSGTTLAQFDGTIDMVVTNPPYIPEAQIPEQPEVRDHDPKAALYGGSADGTLIPERIVMRAAGLLRPGGVLAAVLYSGKVIGDAEKQAALAFFKALPLTQYTVLVCEFANWAQTAPLPCFVIKK